MTDRDVSDNDMPDFRKVTRREMPAITDASLAALLDGANLPDTSQPELQAVAHALGALTAGPASDELSGEGAALAAFRNQAEVLRTARAARRRRPARPFLLPSARAAAVAAAAVIGLGGFATAAYARVLPAPIQRIAHDVFGAPDTGGPSAGGRPSVSQSQGGPGASGPAAHGLCTAWARAKAHGTAKQQAVAFRNLAAAADGAGNVPAYCAAVPGHGASPSSRPARFPTPHPAGQPDSPPTPHPAGQPDSPPTPHPTGQPDSPRSSPPGGQR